MIITKYLDTHLLTFKFQQCAMCKEPHLIFVTDATDGVCGEKIGHVEKFSPWLVVKWKISPHYKCGDDSVKWRMNNVWIMCTIFDVLSHFLLFCCKISLFYDLRCFVAKSVLSRFTRFGVEKNLVKNFACGEKRTNIRYAFRKFSENSSNLSDPIVPKVSSAPFHNHLGSNNLCCVGQIVNVFRSSWPCQLDGWDKWWNLNMEQCCLQYLLPLMQ